MFISLGDDLGNDFLASMAQAGCRGDPVHCAEGCLLTTGQACARGMMKIGEQRLRDAML